MTYRGRVENGAVVLEPGVDLSEGTEVRVEVPPWTLADDLLQAPTLDEAMDRLRLLYKVRQGIQQADAGQTVSHQEARERLAVWLD